MKTIGILTSIVLKNLILLALLPVQRKHENSGDRKLCLSRANIARWFVHPKYQVGYCGENLEDKQE